MSTLLVDLKDSVIAGVSLAPKLVSTNADATGAAVDLSNGTVWGAAHLMVGTVAGTTPTMDLKLQSNTTSATTGFTDITGAAFTQVITSAQSEIINFQVPPGRPYVRCTGTLGTQVTGMMSSVAIFQQKKFVGETNSGVSRSPST